MPVRKRNRTGDRLRAAGFDRSYYSRGDRRFHVRCSQCEAAVINNVACHERGCPNQRKKETDD